MVRAMACLALLSVATPVSAAESSAGPQEAEKKTGLSAIDIGGYVTIAMGGALLAGGAAAAIFALHKRIQLEAVCQPRDHCPVAAQPDIDQMQLTAHLATGLSVPGFLSVGIGAGLLLWPEGASANVALSY